MDFADQRPIRRVEPDPDHWRRYIQRGTWPGSVPAVAALGRGLELGPLTVLVGENGSGKSTLVEGIAMAYGLNPEGGSTGARHRTR